MKVTKIKRYGKATMGKKKNYRLSLGQKKEGGRKRIRKNAGENMAINGTWTTCGQGFAVNSNSRVNSCELCSASRMKFTYSNSSVNTPVKKKSPVIGQDKNLARETDIESLPLDILVRIVCNFCHDELKPLFHVSSKFREAVIIARQLHFDYITPVRVRGSKRGASYWMLDERSQNCLRRFGGLEFLYSSSKRPATPNAPKKAGKFQKSQISFQDMKEVATLLFSPGMPTKDDGATHTNQNHLLGSGSNTTNSVLSIEDELCEAVARNRL